MIADDTELTTQHQQRAFAAWCGVARDWRWPRLTPARWAALAIQLVLVNALALVAASFLPASDTMHLPGVALLVVGGLLMVSLQETLLEAERPVLWQWASCVRSRPWGLARNALLAAALGAVGALPAAIGIALLQPSVHSPFPGLLYGAACVCLLAFFHAASWLRQGNPSTSAGVRQRLLRLAELVIIAAILRTGFAALARPAVLAVSFPLAVAFACSFWHALPERTTLALTPSLPQAPALTATYALGTLLVLQFVRGFTAGVTTRAGWFPAHAAAISFLMGGIGIVGVSLFWLWLRGVPALRAQLGLSPGNGLRVILREAVLWSAPSILFNQAYWAFAVRRPAEAIQPASDSPAAMTVLAGSPLVMVGVSVIAAPIIEELVFRGMFHRTLRTHWSVAPSLLLSTMVFVTDHTLSAAIPVFVSSACITLALERSRSLYTAMLVHGVYNAVLALQLLSR